MFHLLFEQSGTFKNEFKKMGFQAEDYDILNEFNETDHIIDLYHEINEAYGGGRSIFDHIDSDQDQVMAFFPCIRFSNQAYLSFQGKAKQMKKWSLEQKLEYTMKMHEDLHGLYLLISKLVIVCCRKGIRCIIENPYSEEHYLTRYWPCRAALIDRDRYATGDYYHKPTQYFFINREPSSNFLFEGVNIKPKKRIDYSRHGAERSMISPDYANRFIREYILTKEELENYEKANH